MKKKTLHESGDDTEKGKKQPGIVQDNNLARLNPYQ